MAKIPKRIEIVSSSNKALSSMSLKSRQGVKAVLSRHFNDVRVTLVDKLADLEALTARKPDLVFLGMNYVPGDFLSGAQDKQIWLPSYLDERGILYTGSDQAARRIESSKHLAKERMNSQAINTSSFFVARKNRLQSSSEIKIAYPLFVKPTNLGGGAGIDSDSVVVNYGELKQKTQFIAETFLSDSLVEKYLPGREFSVAILKDAQLGSYTVMPLELIAPPDQNGRRILTATVKAADTENFKAVAEESVYAEVSELALKAFQALGARDYGRIDIRMNEVGVPHFLEANLTPSLIEFYGNFPKACMLNQKIDYETMLLRIVNLAFNRSSLPTVSLPAQTSLSPAFG